MNERVKEVRKQLNLSQEKFGSKLGVTKSAISRMELGTYNLTDTMIKLISSNFNVSEEWLRNGIGDMFIEPDTFSLDEFLKSKNATDFEIELVKSFFEIPENFRNDFLNRLKKYIISNFENNDILATKEESFEERKKRELDAYALELDAEEKGRILSVSEKPKGA